MVTIVDREKSRTTPKIGNSVFLLFYGLDHELDGHILNFEGVYNSLFNAQMATKIAHQNWIKDYRGRYFATGNTIGHIQWGYTVIECKIGDICEISMNYDSLFGDTLL